MREFRILNGKFSGSYWIYDNRKEIEENITIKRWAEEDNLEVGDWIECLDGNIMQILHIYKKENKEFIIFPSGTVRRIMRKDKSYWYDNLYGNGYIRNGKFTNKRIVYDIDNIKANAIGMIMGQGISLYQAYKTVAGSNITKQRAISLIRKEGFMEGLQETIPINIKNMLIEKKGKDWIVTQLIECVEKARPGSMSHISAIKLVIDSCGLGEKQTIGKKLNEIEEANYSILPPPVLK